VLKKSGGEEVSSPGLVWMRIWFVGSEEFDYV